MNRKPTFAESVRNFVEGKGFYVAVLVCVAAIGVSGFYLLRSVGAPEQPDNTPVSGSASVTVTPSPSVTPKPSPSPSPSASASATPKASASPAPRETPPSVTAPSPSPSSPSPVPSIVPARPTALVYTWPVKGAVLADFSLETLAYDETMGDWRTHSGLDIAAAPGTSVMATADGTVNKVYSDDLMGTTVVIDHGNGMVSSYANLQTQPAVAEGDIVHTGTVIGAVGSTAIAECGRPAHLHFELSEDGIAVDPELYLPETR